MLLLTSTSDKLQVVTGSAGTIDVHASWMDNVSGAVAPGRTNTNIATAATTDVVASPAASTQRNVKTLHVRNRGVANNDVTVQHTDGTIVSQLYKKTLAPQETLQYIDEIGFIVPPLVLAGSGNVGTSVLGLSGSTTSTTTLNITFREAVLRAADGSGRLYPNGSFNVNMAAAVGAGGPDAALSDGDVHFYAIWGSVPGGGGICSMSGPNTGPTLPSGYTHWCYLTTLKRASSVFPNTNTVLRGNKVLYTATPTAAYSSNGSGTPVNTSVAAFVPAIAETTDINATASGGTGTSDTGWYIQYGTASGIYAIRQFILIIGGSHSNGVSLAFELANVGQAVWWVWTNTANPGDLVTSSLTFYVTGYTVPNGG